MAKSKSSNKWLREHFDDPYVKKSQQEGYRSRAVYKLLEIQEKDKIIKPNMVIVDLGAAPGGWMQVTKKLVGKNGCVIGLDLLAIEPIADTAFIQGDFSADETYQALNALLAGRPVDIVMSDIAPNMSGMKGVDQPKAMYLVELALDFAKQNLKKDGVFLTKVFHGQGFDALVADCRKHFLSVKTRKPKASRDRSPEVYLLAQGFIV
ncbi:MAG: 23S rRNA methyltransferase [Legionellales bacterium]|nr:23S rRNA methyltransferase [Legionellales bacterium]